MLELEQPAELPDSAATEVDPAALPDDNLESTDAELEPVQPTEEEELEEELEGVKLRGKKEALEKIKAERLMQADYTRKTQSHAEEKRAFQAEREQWQQVAQLQQQTFDDAAELRAVNKRASQIQQALPVIAQQDAQRAQELLIELNQLQAQGGQLQGSIAHKNSQMQLMAQREHAERTNKAEAIVAGVFKDWGPVRYQAIQDYAKADGIDQEQLRQLLVNVPQAAKLLNKAMQFDQYLKQRAKPKEQPAPPVTRLTGGNVASAKDPAAMSDREFAEWRKRQIAQRK